MEQIQKYFQENPNGFGFIIIGFGVTLLLASVFNWNWIFGNISRVNYSADKIDGLVNLFGRKVARIIVGIISILVVIAGVVWVVLYR